MNMLWRKPPTPRPRSYSVPAGQRVYAIGDVHGRLDLLEDIVDQIELEERARPSAGTSLIFLGDLIDRGPDSAGVVDRVRALGSSGAWTVRHLKGNHEEVMLLAARGDASAARVFLQIGGRDTLRSLGIDDEEIDRGNFADLANLLKARVPGDVLAFLDAGEDIIEIGDYAFVHAGVRPGVALADQKRADLRWIRKEFLLSADDHEKMIVHGHSIVAQVEMLHNRIGVDTGAFAHGALSAIMLEGESRRVFTAPADQAGPSARATTSGGSGTRPARAMGVS